MNSLAGEVIWRKHSELFGTAIRQSYTPADTCTYTTNGRIGRDSAYIAFHYHRVTAEQFLGPELRLSRT